MASTLTAVRLDKWLWAARFYKTRSLATDAVDGGHVQVNSLRVKPAKDVRVGDRIQLVIGDLHWELLVEALADKRGPATVARTLYSESEQSQAARLAEIEARRLVNEPGRNAYRPTKRDRRAMEKLRS